jgi:hypothetical protein
MNGRICWSIIKDYFEFYGISDFDKLNLYISCIRKLEIVYNEYMAKQQKGKANGN